jgi:hypothetical protein
MGYSLPCPLRIRSCKRRYDLESCGENVWVEIPTVVGLILLIGSHYFPPTLNLKSLPITSAFFSRRSWIRIIFVLLWLGILTLLVSTGNAVYFCLIPIITLNLREMPYTPPRVFFILASSFVLSAVVVYLI